MTFVHRRWRVIAGGLIVSAALFPVQADPPKATAPGSKPSPQRAAQVQPAPHPPWFVPVEASVRYNPMDPEPWSIARGRALYQYRCAACHGERGLGDGPIGAALKPKPTNLAAVGQHGMDGDVAWRIAEGRGVMPSWKQVMTQNQIWDVVNYLRTLARKN